MDMSRCLINWLDPFDFCFNIAFLFVYKKSWSYEVVERDLDLERGDVLFNGKLLRK